MILHQVQTMYYLVGHVKLNPCIPKKLFTPLPKPDHGPLEFEEQDVQR
jgi:hypothetical protein